MRGRGVVAASALVAGLLAGLAAPVSGQARVRASVDTTLVTVGDRITLTVQVEHPADASVLWPDSVDLSPFEVVDAQIEPTGADGTTSTARLLLAAFELGELEIPSLEISVAYADGTTEAMDTDRFGIEVVSVGTDEGGDIREIRGPLSIPVGAVRIALWGLLFMLLGAALVVGWRRWRAGRWEAEPARAATPPRPPHEIALEALDRLAASSLLERGEVKAYHVEASEIVRRYVEEALAVPALELTTAELGHRLEGRGVPDRTRESIRRFLEPCDRVKFAKVRPGAEESRALVGLGREVVEAAAAWLQAEASAAREDAASGGSTTAGERAGSVGEAA